MASSERVRWRLTQVTFSVHRPNEYTRWRPRLDKGNPWFGAVVWGPFVVSWDRERLPDEVGVIDAEEARP